MAVPKGILLEAINREFEGKSISRTLKESIAEIWSEDIEDESGIEAYIKDRAGIILLSSIEADRRVNEALKKVEKKVEPKTEPKVEPKVEQVSTDDAPKWAEALLANQKALEDKILGFETKQIQKTLSERFKTHPDLKGIPEFMFKGRIPTTDEDFENAVSELKTDFTDYAKEMKLESFGGDRPDNYGFRKDPNEVTEFSTAQIDKIFNQIN